MKYSASAQTLRDRGIGRAEKTRCDQISEVRAAEMQQDTTSYMVEIGGRSTKVIASLLELPYSKMLYLRLSFMSNR